jgi:hypothetical protein
MSFKRFFYENEKLELKSPKPITVTYKSVDGVIKQEIYSGPDAEQKAKDFIDHWVGLNGEIGEGANYIVADDGVGIVAVKGIDISDLLGRKKPSPDLPNGYTHNLLRTLLLLNFPIFLNHGELDNNSYVFDFETGVKRYNRKEKGRLLIYISYDRDSSDLRLDLHIFTFFPGTPDEKRLFDFKDIKPTLDFQKDLKNIESFFLQYEKEIKEVEQYIKNDNALQG